MTFPREILGEETEATPEPSISVSALLEAFTLECIKSVLETFDADAEAVAVRQAEAREAWANDRQLVEGAYYRHSRYGCTRRIIEINGQNIQWADQYGPGFCKRTSFLNRVAGPL